MKFRFCFPVLLFLNLVLSNNSTHAQNDLKLWYDKPATEWMTEALPDRWKSGKIEGLKVRGEHTVNLEWEEGKVKEAQIQPGANGLIKVKYNGRLQEIKCSKGQLITIVG